MRPTARTPVAVRTTTLCALAAALIGGPVGAAVAAPHDAPAFHQVAVAPMAPVPPPVPPTNSVVCPDQVAPPAPIDASEKPTPGGTVPPPVPEPATPAGGPRMAECNYVLPSNAPPLPADLGFESWVLQDLDTGAVLAARDPHARQRPASLIKMLLAQVSARELDPAKVVVGTQDDANQEGTRVGIGPGGQYTVAMLLHALLMASGNDVAHALAVQLGGMQVAVDKMNALARQLGMNDTRAASPSGLDAPGMSTSAYDLSVIFRTDLATPLLADAMHTTQLPFPGYGGKPGFVVNNDNELLRSYPGDMGGKTGYTDDAQQTYANAATRNGHRIALIMTRGTNHLSGRWQNARELMDYGFTLENLHSTAVGHVALTAVTTTANGADGVAKQVQGTTGHGNAQVAAVPTTQMTTFGNVGGPLTVLAGVGLLLIALLYLKRRKAKARRAAAARAVASAKTVRVAALVPPTEPTPTSRVPRTTGTEPARATAPIPAAARTTRTVQPAGSPNGQPAAMGNGQPARRPAVTAVGQPARPAARPASADPRPLGERLNGPSFNGSSHNSAGHNGAGSNGAGSGAYEQNGAPEWPAAPEWPT